MISKNMWLWLVYGIGIRLASASCSGESCIQGPASVVKEVESVSTWNRVLPSRKSLLCPCSRIPPPKFPEDYTYSPGLGAYKLHTRAMSWNLARKACYDEGGQLAVVNSEAEALQLQDMFVKSGSFIGAENDFQAFVGIQDMYNEDDWVSVVGEPLASTGYALWTRWTSPMGINDGTQEPTGGIGENCGTLVRNIWSTFKTGGYNDFSCDANMAFFCEISFAIQ